MFEYYRYINLLFENQAKKLQKQLLQPKKNHTFYIKKHVSACLIVSFLSLNNAIGQTFSLKKKIDSNDITNIHYNRYSNVFVTDEKGNINAFDLNGDSLKSYSTERPFQCSVLNAFTSLQVFLFSEPDQSYMWIDRQLSTAKTTTFQQESTGYISTCNISSDGQIWLIDQDDFTLKKFNPTTNQSSIKVPLLTYQVKKLDVPNLIEHQNNLFFKNKSNLYVLDLFGNLIYNITCTEDSRISLYNNYLFILENENSIRKKELYLKTESTIQLPIEKVKNFIWINKTLVLVTKESIYFYDVS